MFKKLIIAFAAAVGIASPTLAADFPSEKPIKIVVGYNAGGLTDVIARMTADMLQKRLGQAVVVENRPGASAAIAGAFVASSPADGYTLYFSSSDISVNPAVRKEPPYNADSFTYIIRPFFAPSLILAAPKTGIKTLEGLIDEMKKNPGKLRYGSVGVGHFTHMGTVQFAKAAGVNVVHVPYSGVAPMYTDLLAGNIDFTLAASLPFLDGITVLGSSGTERHPKYPDLPTLIELGYKDAKLDTWFSIVGPAGLPQPVTERLTSELSAIFKDPAAIAAFEDRVGIAPQKEPPTGNAFKSYVVETTNSWTEIAKKNNITIEQ